MKTELSKQLFLKPEMRVRYIKLGEGGKWEKDCIKNNVIRFGFGTYKEERFKLCMARRWDELVKQFIADGRNQSTANRFTKETRLFFESDATTVWITFVGEYFYWGALESTPPERYFDGDGVSRKIAGGWRNTDINGEILTKEKLSGALTKLAAYRGTSCSVDVSDYVIRRINGQKLPEVERAVEERERIKESVQAMMKLLTWQDFEIMVGLVFSTSGWRRQGAVGKAQKFLDLDLTLPSTGERACVQIKSETTSAQLAEYVEQLDDAGEFHTMFYVFHSGEAVTDDERVKVIGPEKLAELVFDAGLTSWLIDKVS
jgi:hypothetical protein